MPTHRQHGDNYIKVHLILNTSIFSNGLIIKQFMRGRDDPVVRVLYSDQCVLGSILAQCHV